MEISFEKCIYFQKSGQITVAFCWLWWYYISPFGGGKKERKEGRQGGREGGRKERKKGKNHCKTLYFPVQILLELLGPPLLMCVRSNSGRNRRTAAIPYFEMSIKRNLDVIYRRVGRYSLFYSFP